MRKRVFAKSALATLYGEFGLRYRLKMRVSAMVYAIPRNYSSDPNHRINAGDGRAGRDKLVNVGFLLCVSLDVEPAE